MVKPRGSLAIGAIGVLALISVVAAYAVQAYLYRLPDPRTADREGVLRWLVLADLNEQSEETRRQLVDRIEGLFADEDGLADGAERLSASDLERVQVNAARLKKTWFFAKVDGYHTLSDADRPAYVDRQLRTLFRWADVDHQLCEARGEAGERPDAGVASHLGSFFDSLEQWRSDAEPAEGERIRAVVKAGLIRWLATYDLAKQSESVRQRVVAGLERQLGKQLDFNGASGGLSTDEAACFWRNVELLAETWFLAKSVEFVAIEQPRRSEFVARQLTVVEQLAAHLPAASAGGSKPGESKSGGSSSSATAAAARVERLIAAAPAEQRHAARRFADALRGAWFVKQMQSLLPAVNSPR